MRAPTWFRIDGTPRMRREFGALLLGLALITLWDASPLDLWLAQRYGDAHGFAWDHHWLTYGVLHEGGKWLARLMVAWLVLSIWWPSGPARGLGREARLWWLGTTLFNMALIAALKRASLTSCPAELIQFGGHSLYISHWSLGVPDGGPGHCFPSGHASSALAFLSGYFVLRGSAVQPGGAHDAERARMARRWLLATVLMGAAYGWGQMMRGSHYFSHTLWTAWFCAAASMTAAWVAEQRGWFAADAGPTLARATQALGMPLAHISAPRDRSAVAPRHDTAQSPNSEA